MQQNTQPDHAPSFQDLPPLLTLKQIVGDPVRGIPAIIPISRTTWWLGIKTGRFPLPIRLTPRRIAWKREAIIDVLNSF